MSMNRRANDASPEPAPGLGVFLVATGKDQDCKPELIRNYLQKHVGDVRIVTSSRSYTNDKTFLTMEFAAPGMVQNAINNFNYSKVNGCLININRFRSKNMQGRNSFGGFQKGFTVTREGDRQGRVHQTMRGRNQSQCSKQERDRAMEEKMRSMSPNTAARYIDTRKHSKRDVNRSRSRSNSSSGSPRRGHSRRRNHSHSSYSRSRSPSRDYSRSRSRSPAKSRSWSSDGNSKRNRQNSRSKQSPSHSRSRSRSKQRSRSRSRSPRQSHSRSRSRSRSPRRSRSRSHSSSRYHGHRSRRRHRSERRRDQDEELPKVISAGEVFLTVPLDSLTEEEQKLIKEKRNEMSEVFRQDCSTVVSVARLFSSYSRHLESDLESTLRRALADIGQRYVNDFQSWLKETVPNAVGEFKEGDTPIEAT